MTGNLPTPAGVELRAVTGSPENPYLVDIPPGRPLRARLILSVWLPLVVLTLVLATMGTGRLGSEWVLPELLAVLACLGLVLWGKRSRGDVLSSNRALVAIDRQLLREDHVGAMAALRKVLSGGLLAYDRARALHLLGQIAEARGDFAHAAEVYERAVLALPVRRGVLGMAFAQLAPVLGVKRAFCLAAAGRLEDAQRVLDAAHDRDEFPGVRALAVRARAVLLARRGEHQALVDLATREHVRIKNGLLHRDRALMRVLLGWGRSCASGAFRSPPPPGFGEDPELRAWIAKAVPEAAHTLGGG